MGENWLIIERTKKFDKFLKHINDKAFREKAYKQIQKIITDPEIGKPMRHDRKGTRELYLSPFRISYSYFNDLDKLILLDIYHKDEQ